MPKAQFFSLDLMIGAGVLLFLLVTYFIVLNQMLQHAQAFETTRIMGEKALSASRALAESPGETAAWQALAAANSSTTASIGASDAFLELNEAKLARLSSLGYNDSRKLLGLEKYDYLLIVRRPNGTLFYSTGLPPAPQSIERVAYRIALLNGTPAVMEVHVWQ